MIDVDDTIQISDVHNRTRLIRRAFVDKDRKPVKGMPELYWSIVTRLSHTNPPNFYYLSASPLFFSGSIKRFIDIHYPDGELFLRNMNIIQLSRFLWDLKPVGVREYKVKKMDEIHKRFPTHQFYCIGDSIHCDPEVYAEMYCYFIVSFDE